MSTRRPIRRYNRLQRALLLSRHYGRTRVGIPLSGLLRLVFSVVAGVTVTTLCCALLACALHRLFFSRSALELVFWYLWMPGLTLFGWASQSYGNSKTEAWEAELRRAMTEPPPAFIHETVPEAEILVRASVALDKNAAQAVLLRPAAGGSSAAPETLLRPLDKQIEHPPPPM